MPADWRRVRLGEVVRVKHGFAFSGMSPNSDPSLPVVVGIGNFDYSGGFRFESTTVKRYLGDYPLEFELTPGDVLLAMTCQTSGGEILGIPGTVPDDGQLYLHNQRLGKVEVHDPDKVHAPFIFHLARWSDFNHYLFSTASGSKILHTSPGRIESFQVDLPPVEEQRAIAATLGALDDKIESNLRTSSLLLQLSRTLFHRARQEWQSAAETTFGEFSDVYGGATPKTAEADFWSGPHAWTTPTDVTALDTPYLFSTSRSITDEGLASCATTLHPVGTILMTSRATIGVFAVNQVPMSTNQGFIVVRPKLDHHRWFLFEEMRSRVDEFLAHANGSTFLELSRGRFKSLPLDVPSDRELRELHIQLGPLHAKATHLSRESTKLAQLRDAVLPELMSGRIRVPEARDAVANMITETEVA